MSKVEIVNMVIFAVSWAAGIGVLYLFLKNKWTDIQFRNVSSSFLLSGAIGLVAAFAGAKANISFWLTWIIYAAAAAYVTYRLLNKKQEGAGGVYGRSLSSGEKLERDEQIHLIILRGILALVGLAFIVYGLFTHQPCDIDGVFLNCRLTGTIADYIGVILFGGGMFVMSGLWAGSKYIMNPVGSDAFSKVLFIAMAAGIGMIWIF
jgi:hypothetical protein